MIETLVAAAAVLLPTSAIVKGLEYARDRAGVQFAKVPGPARVLVAVATAVAFSVTAPELGLSFDVAQIPAPVVHAAVVGLLYNIAKPLLKRFGLTGDKAQTKEV